MGLSPSPRRFSDSPFSLARVVRVTDEGSVLYRAEPDHCRRFPGAASADLRGGPERNFQVFGALDFLAELTQHIPEKGEHLTRYYGWYSHRRRGQRAKAAVAVKPKDTDSTHPAKSGRESPAAHSRPGSRATWAVLIKRVYEVDPLECPKCGGLMKIISFIERGQSDVIERILRHCGLWEGPIRTLAHARPPPKGKRAPPGELELTGIPPDRMFHRRGAGAAPSVAANPNMPPTPAPITVQVQPTPGGFFGEARRVLKLGGRAVVSAMHPAMFLRGTMARFTDPTSGELVQPGSYPHSVAAFVMAGIDAGFRLERVEEFSPSTDTAARFPRAEKYVGWPMLVLLRLRA